MNDCYCCSCIALHDGVAWVQDSSSLLAHSFTFFLLFFLDLCLFTYFGQFLVFLTPSQGFAQIIASGELLTDHSDVCRSLDIEEHANYDVGHSHTAQVSTCVRYRDSRR